MIPRCLVYRLGLVPFHAAWKLQNNLATCIASSSCPPSLLLLQHPHVFTFGRRSQIANLLWSEQELERRGVETIWVDRGGDVTYHGPGQLVGYPLLPLAPGGIYASSKLAASNLSINKNHNHLSAYHSLPKADYLGYLRRLEEVLIRTLAGFRIESFRIPGKTGVFVNLAPSGVAAKIAAIGVKVDARGISRHGFALNVNPDMAYWEGIVACGLADHPAASMAQMSEPTPDIQQIEDRVIQAFGDLLGYDMHIENTNRLLKMMDSK